MRAERPAAAAAARPPTCAPAVVHRLLCIVRLEHPPIGAECAGALVILQGARRAEVIGEPLAARKRATPRCRHPHLPQSRCPTLLQRTGPPGRLKSSPRV